MAPTLIGMGAKCTLLSPGLASKCLAKRALKMSKDPKYMSPFAKASIQAHQEMTGGKEDDITVVVA